MKLREQLEARERAILAPQAAKSADSRGRLRPEREDDVRPAFQRDRDRIIHCKAFRRLKHKTQVFFSPRGDHYRTRLTHTLEVSQIARTIAKVLRLNEELTEAIALGHDYMVLTDHSPRLTVAHGLDAERLLAQLDEVAGLNEQLAPFRILTGIEVDILEDGTLDQTEELLARLDVVVASVHSKLRMERDEMTRWMAVAVANPHVDVLGHCTGRLVVGRGRPESEFDPELIFTACREYGTAVEINSRPERLDPPKRLLRMAVEMGCLVSIDTDAHAPGQLDYPLLGCERAEAAGIDAERIVNTWPVERLLDWAKP